MPAPPLATVRQSTLDVLSSLLNRGEPVALLDYPLHHNAGDSLIHAGTMSYLRALGIVVRYHTTSGRYVADQLRSRHPDGPILLQGGGNFGDRWPDSQLFREHVLADFPDRRIIHLPQTLEMTSTTAERVRRALESHRALTILLRDTRSLAQSMALFPGVDARFCPDLAFGYDAPAPAPPARVDVLQLKRADSESAVRGDLFLLEGDISVETTDWGLSPTQYARWRLLRAPGGIVRRAPAMNALLYPTLVHPAYERLTTLAVRAAEQKISRGRVVVTDRLHGAVLAALLSRPVVVRDNANKKISAILSDYLGTFPGVSLASSAASATAQARAHLDDAVQFGDGS